MKKYLDIKGSTIIEEGGNIKGTVEDCIIDLKKLRICSFLITSGSIIPSLGLLSLKDIAEYGDVIVLKGEIYKLSKFAVKRNEQIMLQSFIGKEIVNFEGKRIGNLYDVIFDETNGEIKALICRKGFFEDIFEGRKLVITDRKTILGREKIIVEKDNIDIINNISLKKFTRG